MPVNERWQSLINAGLTNHQLFTRSSGTKRRERGCHGSVLNAFLRLRRALVRSSRGVLRCPAFARNGVSEFNQVHATLFLSFPGRSIPIQGRGRRSARGCFPGLAACQAHRGRIGARRRIDERGDRRGRRRSATFRSSAVGMWRLRRPSSNSRPSVRVRKIAHDADIPFSSNPRCGERANPIRPRSVHAGRSIVVRNRPARMLRCSTALVRRAQRPEWRPPPGRR